MSRISFKRKLKRPARFSLSTLLTDISTSSTTQRHLPGTASLQTQESLPGAWGGHHRDYSRTGENGDANGLKDGGPLDWYVEGPGRRVGYDDLTAIDWIFEYTKERQRKRLLYSSGQGFLGHVRQVLDGSHVWVVLITAGVAVGIIAACINIASNWLGDLKTGYCRSDRGGGHFYLNRNFCCWGHEGDTSQPIFFVGT
jgi:chloride channel 3/4/5